MKKLFFVLLVVSFTASVAMAEVEADLSYYGEDGLSVLLQAPTSSVNLHYNYQGWEGGNKHQEAFFDVPLENSGWDVRVGVAWNDFNNWEHSIGPVLGLARARSFGPFGLNYSVDLYPQMNHGGSTSRGWGGRVMFDHHVSGDVSFHMGYQVRQFWAKWDDSSARDGGFLLGLSFGLPF